MTAAPHLSPRKRQGSRFEHRPLGTERVNYDGYIEVKVRQTGARSGPTRDYVLKHLWLWEAVNGPLPKGHCLKALDGNRLNTDPANWRAIPRAMLTAINGGKAKNRLPYDKAEPEVRPAILALAEVKLRARQLRRPAPDTPAAGTTAAAEQPSPQGADGANGRNPKPTSTAA